MSVVNAINITCYKLQWVLWVMTLGISHSLQVYQNQCFCVIRIHIHNPDIQLGFCGNLVSLVAKDCYLS